MRTSKHKNPAQSLVNKRRITVLARLEDQLKSGNKPIKNIGLSTEKHDEFQALTDSDKKRIEKEITTLKARIR